MDGRSGFHGKGKRERKATQDLPKYSWLWPRALSKMPEAWESNTLLSWRPRVKWQFSNWKCPSPRQSPTWKVLKELVKSLLSVSDSMVEPEETQKNSKERSFNPGLRESLERSRMSSRWSMEAPDSGRSGRVQKKGSMPDWSHLGFSTL